MHAQPKIVSLDPFGARRRPLLFSALFLGALPFLGTFDVMAQDDTAGKTEEIVFATEAFLATLDTSQADAVQFGFDPAATPAAASYALNPPGGAGGPGGGTPPEGAPPQGGGGGGGGFAGLVGEEYGEARWSNFPVSDVPRPGVALGTLSADQHEAAMTLLETLLSPDGYQKVLDIMASDEVLSRTDGGGADMGEAYYTLGVFGTPAVDTRWMLQFGGHHLAINFVVSGADGVITPTLTGAQPAVFTREGETVRVLAAENDKAFALLDALDESQRAAAILDYAVGDLVMGPGRWGQTIVPEGLAVSEMTDAQRALLLDLIGEWAGIVDAAYAGPRMAEIEADLNETFFAWSGPTTHEADRNGSSYYRIQGPRLIIEFAPQGVGGDTTMHVHTIYRDPTNDYGLGFTAP